MKIGLVRHFKVDHKKHRFLSPSEFEAVMKQYDQDPVIPNGLSLNQGEWDICLCSTLPRARETASKIYSGKTIFSDQFVEVNMYPFTKTNIKLPSFFWHVGARIAWYKNKPTQKETKNDTNQRVKKAYELILDQKKASVLIVSHGFFMHQLYNELVQNGFKGKIDEAPRNGKLYVVSK